MITKAIIPVAGWGTRRLPITKAIEKCMLPIGNRPLVDYVVEDCIRAGIKDIYFVVSEGSTQVQAFYEDNATLNAYLVSQNKEDFLPMVRPLPGINFHFVTQPNDGRYGTAVPIGLVYPQLAQGESVVVLMGDDFIYHAEGGSEVARMLHETPENGNMMLGVNVDPALVSRYGVVDFDEHGNFRSIVEKPDPSQAPSTLINVSKYVMNYDLLTAISQYTQIVLSGEYYVTDPINTYIMNGGSMRVMQAEGQYLDGGTVHGWMHANNVVMGGNPRGY